MYKINDYVVYKKDVCRVKDIKENDYNEKYYALIPLSDESLIIDVPVENKQGSIRSIISKKEATKVIDMIPLIEPITDLNDKLLESEYKRLLYSGSYEDLIKIIKTTYIRNNNRILNKRKIGEKDDAYFKKAEKLLYDELSISYDMSYDEMKEYIVKKVENMLK